MKTAMAKTMLKNINGGRPKIRIVAIFFGSF